MVVYSVFPFFLKTYVVDTQKNRFNVVDTQKILFEDSKHMLKIDG